jgi:hypothetical protein
MQVGQYWKAIGATLVAALAAGATALQGDNTIGAQDAIVMVTAVLGSGFFVWLVTKYTGAKAVVAGLTISLASLSTAISDDQVVTNAEWLTALGTGLAGALAVYQITNEDPQTPADGNPPADNL